MVILLTVLWTSQSYIVKPQIMQKRAKPCWIKLTITWNYSLKKQNKYFSSKKIPRIPFTFFCISARAKRSNRPIALRKAHHDVACHKDINKTHNEIHTQTNKQKPTKQLLGGSAERCKHLKYIYKFETNCIQSWNIAEHIQLI